MKTKYKSYSQIVLITVLLTASCFFATTAAFGQTTTFTWTNQYVGHVGGSGDMNQTTNWSPVTANGPSSSTGPDPVSGWYGDLVLFDGQTTNAIAVTESGGN